MILYWEIDSTIIVSGYLLGLLLSYFKIYSICYEGVQLKIQTFQGVIRNKIKYFGGTKGKFIYLIQKFPFSSANMLYIFAFMVHSITFQHRLVQDD